MELLSELADIGLVESNSKNTSISLSLADKE